MRLAIIDLGTNTFNLLIADINERGKFNILFHDKISVKLGEGGINSNQILPVPFQRGIDAIGLHLESILKYKTETIQAFATSAIRSALNGADFVTAVKEKFGIHIQVIDGNREAELIYEGVKMGVKMDDSNSLIMDIGGGSTEFIIANSEKYLWKHSFDLGAARLLEKFKPHDPILETEIVSFENYFDAQLAPLKEAVAHFGITELIGSSGSFDTFAEMICHKFYSPINLTQQTSYDFSLNDFYNIHAQLLKSDKEERLATPGIIEMRVDMIVVSTIFTNYILQKFKLSKMRLSTYALKEGVIAQMIKTQVTN